MGLTIQSLSSTDSSLCSSPTPNLASLSPMPDLRRDSQADEMLTLPAPDGFADSRRNSSNMPQEYVILFNYSNSSNLEFHFLANPKAFDSDCSQIKISFFYFRQFIFETPTVEKVLTELKETEKKTLTNGNPQYSEENQAETQSDFQVTVTPTTLDTSSLTDDTTIQDALISPDSDSIQSGNVSPENMNTVQNYAKVNPMKGSCSSSIVSSESMVSDTLDSKSFTVKNSESEIGKHYKQNSELDEYFSN